MNNLVGYNNLAPYARISVFFFVSAAAALYHSTIVEGSFVYLFATAYCSCTCLLLYENKVCCCFLSFFV